MAEGLFGGKDRARLEGDIREYVHNSGIEGRVLSNYQHNSSGINPDQKFQSGTVEIASKKSGIITEHDKRNQNLAADAKAGNAELKAKAKETLFNEQEFKQVGDSVKNEYTGINSRVEKAGVARGNEYNAISAKVAKDIKEGAERSKSTTGDIKPKFIEKKKGRV
ncbi:hypothetical protein GAMM_100001 [Gammaproteobacteria bacterium]